MDIKHYGSDTINRINITVSEDMGHLSIEPINIPSEIIDEISNDTYNELENINEIYINCIYLKNNVSKNKKIIKKGLWL